MFRAKDPARAAKIAQAMKAACANDRIGYDQWQRDTLYDLAKNVGFDPAKVTTACETDCSALVRVCCAYAGILAGNFRTYNEPSMLLATGAFAELKGTKYADGSDYLGAGDILCTASSGHTVVTVVSLRGMAVLADANYVIPLPMAQSSDAYAYWLQIYEAATEPKIGLFAGSGAGISSAFAVIEYTKK